MPADRPDSREVVGLVGAAAAACCALPVLLGLAGGITVAGLGVRSWLLVLAGTAGVIASWSWWRFRRRGRRPTPVRDERSVDVTDPG